MIIILAAMKEEVDAIVSHVQTPIKNHSPFGDVILGTIHQQQVVIAQTGIGKAVAAATTAYMLNQYNTTCIINIGSAGGLSNDLTIGDVIIANKVSYHDWDLSAFNYPKGWENTSMVFTMDNSLIQLAQQATKNNRIKAWVGPIVSGDQFISRADQFETIIDTFSGVLAVEMEAAAVGHIANLFNVPCAILRSISDVVFDENSTSDFNTYIKKAAAQSAAAIVSTIQLLGAQ